MTEVPIGWQCPKCNNDFFLTLEDGRKQCEKCKHVHSTPTPPTIPLKKHKNKVDRSKKNKMTVRNSNKKQFTAKHKQFTAKSKKQYKKLIAHNFGLKFPLQPECKNPFKKTFHKKNVLKSHTQYLYYTEKAFIRQTNRNLIVFPKLETATATPGQSQELKKKLRYKAISVVNGLRLSCPGLKVFAPIQKPISQEYAIKDSFAEQLDFTFKNSIGKIDKSPHTDSSGHTNSGGEVEYFTPEHADTYLKMPLLFERMTHSFLGSLKEFDASIKLEIANKKLHLATLNSMQSTLKTISKAAKPARNRMPTTARKSATYRSVS